MPARGLLLCVGLLLAMPAFAATRADRDACTARVDKPDAGGAACSRVIDDANEPVAERVKALKNRGRDLFKRKDYDRAIADYGRCLTWVLRHQALSLEAIRADR